MVNQLMEIEVATLKTEVEKGKHCETRKTHRNGYRVRRWDTRLGTIYLTIPKVRSGGYQPFFLVNRQRSESALMSVITKELDHEVAQFRQSELNSFYPVVWIDALCEKIREDRKVTRKSAHTLFSGSGMFLRNSCRRCLYVDWLKI